MKLDLKVIDEIQHPSIRDRLEQRILTAFDVDLHQIDVANIELTQNA